MGIFLSIIHKIGLRNILAGLGIILSLGFIWNWHYNTINKLENNILKQEKIISKKDIQIRTLQTKIFQLEDNLKVAGAELNLCKLEQDAYECIDINIKDTEDEGYFIY